MNGKLANRQSLICSAIAVGLAVLLTESAFADCRGRSGDRILLVSTRPAGCSTNFTTITNQASGSERVSTDCRGQWIDHDPIAMLGTLDPSIPTVVYVHGNQIDSCTARQRGMDVYRCLTRAACDDRSIQFVIFSWSATKVPGLLRDYREKAARTRPVAAQLAWLVNRLPSGSQVGLLGYSYGARVSSGAAHLLAGGSLSGIAMQEARTEHSLRAVFLAAAEDACWLAPYRYHGKAMDEIDTLLVTTNMQDPAMRFFKYLSKTSNPKALGGVGARGLSSDTAARIMTCNVSRSVGKSHDLYRYMSAPGLMRSAWQRLTFADSNGALTPSVANLPESGSSLSLAAK